MSEFTPRVVIFAHHVGASLAPLTDNTCPALLPVGGKPVLAHTLDDVAAAGLGHVTLFVGAHANDVETLVGDGSRWGLGVDYVLARGDEDPSALEGKLSTSNDQDLLLIQGTVLRTPCIEAVLVAARTHPDNLEFEANGKPLGIRLRRGGAMTEQRVSLDARVFTLDSLTGLHRASLAVAAGHCPGLLLPGRERAVGLVVGHASRVPAHCLTNGRARIGTGVRVAPSAVLAGPVAIGDGCLVDSGARVENSVIMPGTYVGRMLDVRNAIVSGRYLLRVDTGTVLRLDDPELLSDMATSGALEKLGEATHRAAGVALLALSLPLWPLALVCALATGGGNPLRRVNLCGNDPRRGQRGGASVRGYEWRTRVPVLRCLPLLLCVCTGRLRLVGVSPLSAHAAGPNAQAWAHARDQAPSGLLGPVQLELAADAPEEERLVAESWFVRQSSWRRDLRYAWLALRALLGERAWRDVARRAPDADVAQGSPA